MKNYWAVERHRHGADAADAVARDALAALVVPNAGLAAPGCGGRARDQRVGADQLLILAHSTLTRRTRLRWLQSRAEGGDGDARDFCALCFDGDGVRQTRKAMASALVQQLRPWSSRRESTAGESWPPKAQRLRGRLGAGTGPPSGGWETFITKMRGNQKYVDWA